MHNTLDHDREELEQITPYVLSRPKIFEMTGYWKQDDPDGYLLACYPALVIPSFLPNQVYILQSTFNRKRNTVSGNSKLFRSAKFDVNCSWNRIIL